MLNNLVVNPAQSGLVGPLFGMLLVLFGVGGVVLLGLELVRQSALVTLAPGLGAAGSSRVLWQRYCTWAVIAVLFASAVLCGPLTLAGLCAFIGWQGGREYAALAKLPPLHLGVLILGGWLTLAAVLIWGTAALLYAPVIAFFGLAALGLCPVEDEACSRFAPMTAGLWGWLYLGWLPAHLLGLATGKVSGLVLLVALGVAISDVGAFCAGKALGGPKLAPRLSPNKTWGGVIGNFVGAALALWLIGFALPSLEIWQFLALIMVIGAGSIWGDLLESLLKRQRGVKDAGALLPGFGGLLDRIDSLLLVAPLVYYLSLIIF
jgi:phosphatidate cytidylyltransferase